MRIIIICLGNTCRSPMAGGLLRKIAFERSHNVEIRTAGLAHHPNQRVATNAVAVMQEIGIDISDEYSKPVAEADLTWADIILTIQRNHKEHLLEDYQLMAHKVRDLDSDVQDPYGRPIAEYRKVRNELEQLLSRFALSLEQSEGGMSGRKPAAGDATY